MKEIDNYSLIMNLENSFINKSFMFEVVDIEQEDIKNDNSVPNEFKMIGNEYTPDSVFDVDINESKFLNDKFYEKNWIKVAYGIPIVFLCVGTEGDSLLISAIEVNELYRGDGFGGIAVNGIEEYAEGEGFDSIVVYPFDTESESFWEHMGYEHSEHGRKMYKNL